MGLTNMDNITKPIIMTPLLKYAFISKCPLVSDRNKCIIWTGSYSTKGYPILQHKGRQYRATRLAYMIANQLDYFELDALHSCDTPACINCNHLFAGSNKDNQRDKVEKDRQAKGETDGRALTSNLEVLEIKRRLYYGETMRAISKKLEIAYHIVASVKSGSWKHIKFNGHELNE